ncbi:hypothetical protein J6590_064038 [Homalodisca vitripennis]|nr:hypothetical protein J6590_064038 [Homalodisca vitripennis]
MTSRGRFLADLGLKVNSDRESIEKTATEPEEVGDNDTNLKSEVENDEMIINEEINEETKLKAFISLFGINMKKVDLIQKSMKSGKTAPEPDRRVRPNKTPAEVVGFVTNHIPS